MCGAVHVPDTSCVVQVRYMYQVDRSVIGSLPVWHDQVFMQHQLSAHLSMLLGQTSPEKVPVCEDWKCTYCIFYHACGGPMKEGNPCETLERDNVQKAGILVA